MCRLVASGYWFLVRAYGEYEHKKRETSNEMANELSIHKFRQLRELLGLSDFESFALARDEFVPFKLGEKANEGFGGGSDKVRNFRALEVNVDAAVGVFAEFGAQHQKHFGEALLDGFLGQRCKELVGL